MKLLLSVLILIGLFSCTKSVKETKLKQDYFYRIATAEGAYSDTSKVVRSESNGGTATEDGDPDEEASDFCKRHPEHNKCKFLPVIWGEIKVVREKTYNVIKWEILTETNVGHYDILRSTDGKNWKSIGTQSVLTSPGVHRYMFVDYLDLPKPF